MLVTWDDPLGQVQAVGASWLPMQLSIVLNSFADSSMSVLLQQLQISEVKAGNSVNFMKREQCARGPSIRRS